MRAERPTAQRERLGPAQRQSLRALRRERSQEEFARLVGLTRSALATYENGRTTPKPSILRQIESRTGMSEEFFLTGQVRNEFELNLAVTGRSFLNESHETSDELALIQALRCVAPSVSKAVVELRLREIGSSAEVHASLGEYLGEVVATLDCIHREERGFDKGQTAEEYLKAARNLFRTAHGVPPLKR
jgi:transcriptional regulator with XRE-family HTH domain